MPIYALGDLTPVIHPEAYVHPEATLIGAVEIGAQSTVWPGAVLRGDANRIVVGERTSIQDGVVVHASSTLSTHIGSGCVVGHLAHLEGCVVEDGCLGSGPPRLSCRAWSFVREPSWPLEPSCHREPRSPAARWRVAFPRRSCSTMSRRAHSRPAPTVTSRTVAGTQQPCGA